MLTCIYNEVNQKASNVMFEYKRCSEPKRRMDKMVKKVSLDGVGYRTENDSIGKKDVPEGVYYGVQ